MNLLKAVSTLSSLKDFLMNIRNDFDTIERESKLLTDNTEFKEEKYRKRKRKSFFEENMENEVVLHGKEKFITETVYVIFDNLISELVRRLEVYENLVGMFDVFFNADMNNEKIRSSASKFIETYKNDINGEQFQNELFHFLEFVKEEQMDNPVDMYKCLNDGLRSTFPNVEIILKIFLTMPITNASGERSFSVLKRVKNYLRKDRKSVV